MTTAAARGGRGSERSAYKIAEKLAKSAGVNVDAWVEEAIAEYAEDLGADPGELTERERLEAIEERIDRLARPVSQTPRRASEPAPRVEREDDFERISSRDEPRPGRGESPRDERRPPRGPAAGDEPDNRRPERSRLDDAIEKIEQRAALVETRAARALESAAGARERERSRLEVAIADIEARAERNQERTGRALEALSGLVEARGVERSRLEQAVEKIEQRASHNEQRTAQALQSLHGLVEARGGERERLQEAIAEVEARAERNAERTAQALEKLGGLVEARQGERERLEAAIERVGKRTEENEARTARALESLTTLVRPAPAPAPEPRSEREDAVASRLEELARRASRTPAPARAQESPRDGDDETFRLVAERLARRRKTRPEAPGDAATPAPRSPEAAPDFTAIVADMQRELRRLADKVEDLAGSAVGPSALDALRLQTREIETAISAASDKAATVEQMERQVAQLAAQIEKLVGASPAPAEMTQALRALAEARAEIDRNAPAIAFQGLERRMEELGARVEAAARRPAVDLRPLEDIARRVETMRVTLERQAATRPDAGALTGALQALNDKLDRAFATGSQSAATMTALQGMVARLEEALQRPTSVSLDARPLEDLARRIEGVRGAVERQGGLAPKMDELRAAVGELKQRVERPAPPAAEIARLETALGQIGPQVEAALARSGVVDLKPIEDLARRIEAVRKAVEAQGAPSAQVERLEDALAEILTRLDRAAHNPEIDAALQKLAAKVDEAVSRPAPKFDAAPIEELARRIESVKGVAERGFAPHAARLETALGDIRARLDKAPANPELDAALRELGAKFDQAVSRPAPKFDATPIEELARRIESVKGVAERGFAPHVARLEAALGDIRARLDKAPANPELDAALRELGAKFDQAVSRPAPKFDATPIEELARRIESVKGAAERGFAPHVARLEAALGDIRARLDQSPPTPELDAALRQLAERFDEAVSRPAPTFDAKPIEELARRIETVKGVAERGFAPHVARLEAALGDIRARLDKSPATAELDAALRQLGAKFDEAVSRPTTVTLDPKPIEDLARRIESVRASLEKPPAVSPQVARLESALGAVSEKLDRAGPIIDANGINTTLAAMNARLEEAFRRPAQVGIDREPIDALAARLEQVRESVERQTEQFDAGRLEKVVRGAVERLERPAIGGVEAASLVSAIEKLAAKIERGPAGFDAERIEDLLNQTLTRLEHPGVDAADFAALTHAVSELAANAGAPGLDGKRVEALLAEIAARVGRPGVEPADFTALTQAVTKLAANVSGATLDGRRVEALLTEIAERVERPGVEPADIGTLAGAISALGDKVDRSGSAFNVSLLEDLTRDVSIRLDALETKIEDRARDTSASENWTHLELAVRELTEKLGEVRAAADTRALEQEVRRLHDKIDDAADAHALPNAFVEQAAQALARDVGARISAASPDALIGHLADINERLDLIGSARAAPAALEDAMHELTEELEALRASRDLVGRGVATLSDMRAEQAQIDRRMDARFSGVQDVLEKVVDRLGRLEREIASEAEPRPPAAPSVRPPGFAAANRPAMSDIPDRSGADARAALAEPDPLAVDIAAHGRTREGDAAQAKSTAINAHIAAARRAANAAAVETERRELVEEARKTAVGANGGLAQRAQTLFRQHQRPVLLSAAGALTILTGVAVLEWRGHPPERKSELDAPAAASTPLASLPAPRDAMTTALDSTPTGAIGREPQVIAAPIAPAAPAAPANPAAGRKPAAAIVAALPAGLDSALALAGASGDVGAEIEIAQRFLEARTVPRDPKAAADWLQAAVDAGSAFAQYRLGALYEKGVGVSKDAARARELYTKAAEAGNARAMHNLAVLYAQDGGAGKPDYAAALEWFRKAASYGVRDSQFNLGVLYGRGLGAPQDMAQSWLWFSLAAKQGDADATRKRDEVANRMDGRAMTTAKKLFDEFKPKTLDPAVNDPPPAPAAAASDAPPANPAPKAATSVKG